ncbi:hypothetical protein M595_5414 [Lyngbya aestuarii BL J]|uniref:Uncharacterized protein n=1 Tax=Lyngbya aestuarii BL J TaxID=1348334 RepID=U7QD27_9CYAN|nr:hypothetical protein M595_5414 [Lyngbya aestuarii BL J]
MGEAWRTSKIIESKTILTHWKRLKTMILQYKNSIQNFNESNKD